MRGDDVHSYHHPFRVRGYLSPSKSSRKDYLLHSVWTLYIRVDHCVHCGPGASAEISPRSIQTLDILVNKHHVDVIFLVSFCCKGRFLFIFICTSHHFLSSVAFLEDYCIILFNSYAMSIVLKPLLPCCTALHCVAFHCIA